MSETTRSAVTSQDDLEGEQAAPPVEADVRRRLSVGAPGGHKDLKVVEAAWGTRVRYQGFETSPRGRHRPPDDPLLQGRNPRQPYPPDFRPVLRRPQFQRELIIEGTREGLDAARARGRTGGRKPKLSAARAATVRRMYAATGPDGKRLHTVAEIAQTAGVHRTTVYDYLNKED